MKKLLQLTFALLATMNSFAQNSGSVTGVVLDEKSEILPFTNVLLLKAKDSTLAKAVTSDIEGKFLIENAPFNNYLLKISMVGYGEIYTPKFILNEANLSFKFEPIKLTLQTQMLKEVSVTAKKPFIEQHLDKTVVNVENSIVGSGNTALEILEKAPGVAIDRQNDQIKLKNKNGVIVMIDGRRNYMSNEVLMQYLTNMSSENIASIEIITNPSSKYDASGNSGIINIKLKKNSSYGTNGTLSIGGGKAFIPNTPSDLWRNSNNISLNHRNAKWNIYGNGNLSRYSFFSDNSIVRTTYFDKESINFDAYSERVGRGLNSTVKLGADYFLNNKTTIGIMADFNNSDGKMIAGGLTKIQMVEANTKTSMTPNSIRNDHSKNYSANLNLKHNFNEKGKEMAFDIDYSGFRNNATQNFDNRYFDSNNIETTVLIQRQNTPSDINIFASKIDFTIPKNDKTKIEFGAKTSFVKTDNDFLFEYQNDSKWNTDLGKTNHFVYTENVNAAYMNYGHSWKKVNFQTGLRLEHTHSTGNSITLDKVVDRNYLSLFPTMFLNQELNKNNALRYSYSRRIDRPNYQQLNPFLFFIDPYTYEEGNAFLKPQFTDNFELTYSYKGATSLTLGYARTHDNMFQVLFQNDSTRSTYQTTINLNKTENYSANLSFPITVTKFWTMQNNISLYRQSFQDPNLSGKALDVSVWAGNFYFSNTLTLKKQWSAELNMWYNTKNLYGIVRVLTPQYAVNMGIQKSFLKKKAKLKLNVSDIFLTSFFTGEVKYQNINLDIHNRWASRRASLTFTYNFGNQNVKGASRRSTATEDLKSRVGGGQN